MVLAPTSCGTLKSLNNAQKDALIGTGAGAAIGAGIGALIGKDGKGAAIGAAIGSAVGAGTGAVIGKKMDEKAAALAKEMENAQVETITDVNGLQAIKVTFESGILFPTNGTTLSAAAKNQLATFSTQMKDLQDTDITIYGHNMMDGSMFQNLNAYENKATWENNPLIFFDTLYEYHVYKIFAVFKTTASVNQGFKYHNMIDAESKEDFDKFIKTCKDLSFYDTGITPEYGDKIICLSTCEYTLENGRLVVAAVRIS